MPHAEGEKAFSALAEKFRRGMEADENKMRVVIDPESLEIDGVLFRDAVLSGVFFELLGRPDRSSDPSDAPPDLPRNTLHFYDGLGLYLNEHHYTKKIHAVCFVLWPDEAIHKTGDEFAGELTVAGHRIETEMTERQIARLPVGIDSHRCGWIKFTGIHSNGRSM